MRRALLVVSLALFAGVALAGDDALFKKEKEIALGAGGFDYLKADAEGRKLYVAHSTKVDVVDMDKGEKTGEVEGVEGAHGTAIVSDAKRGFATAGRRKKVVVFDLETLKVTKEVDTGENPDAIIQVSSVGEVWSMNHRAGTVTCIDAKSLEVTKTIDVGGTLEFAAEDPGKGMVYVNIEDKNLVAAIDAKKHEVTAKYTIEPGESPAGLAIDPKNGLLFVGCNRGKLVVLETAAGKVVTSFDIGRGCDAVAFDAETGNAFASCGEGTTSVFHVKDPKTVEAAGKIETARGAKTCAVDAKTHKLYLAVGVRRNEQGDPKLLVFAPPAKKSEDAK